MLCSDFSDAAAAFNICNTLRGDFMYNAIFTELKKYCDREKCSNFFSHISVDELIELNLLLDKVILFCENTDEDELDCYEFSHDIFLLYKLVDCLSNRDR